MPGVWTLMASTRVVGRSKELERIDAALDAIGRGEPGVLMVAGEAGVGKTRLIGELAARAERRGWRVCVGRCVDLGESTWPLAPLRDIVGDLVDELDAEVLELVLGDARSVLAGLVPELGAAVSEDAADRLSGSVLRVFQRLAQRSPVVVVFEDLHWADGSTRALFAALTRVGRPGSMLVVGTFRDDELHRRHPLRATLAEVARAVRSERLVVPPLGPDATAELVGVLTGNVDGELAASIHRRTAGNPFFVEELLAAQSGGVAGLPATLRDAVLARAATFDGADGRVLDAVAAAGTTLPVVLGDVCGLSPAELQRSLSSLIGSGLLIADGDEVRFRHDLAREVFVDELLPGERERLHAALAASLENRRPDRLGEIAVHWSQAQEGPRTLAASVAAGRQALRAGAAREAFDHFGLALEWWDRVHDPDRLAGSDRAELLAEASTAALYADDVGRAIELREASLSELGDGDRDRLVRAWLDLRRLYRFANRWDDTHAAADRAYELVAAEPPSGELVEALVAVSVSERVRLRFDAGLAHARRAVEVATAVGQAGLIVQSSSQLGEALGDAGDREGAVAIATDVAARCGRDVPPHIQLIAGVQHSGALREVGRFADIPAVARHGVELARETGLGGPRGAWLAEHLVEALVLLGRWSEAEQATHDLADMLSIPVQRGSLGGIWAPALIRMGRVDDARALVEDARRALEEPGFHELRGTLAAGVVLLDAAERRHDEAAATVDRVMACREPGFLGNSELVATAIEAMADAGRRDHPRIASWLAWMEEVDHRPRIPTPEQVVYRDLAYAHFDRLRGETDPMRWAAVADQCTAIGFRYYEAVARLHHAATLLAGASGRSAASHNAAQHELQTSANIAAELRATPLQRTIGDLARRARLPVRNGDPPANDNLTIETDHLGLTPRERHVLSLLARGRTNGEIATELYISTKTASVHVSNILRKLGVTNRVEAATIAERQPFPERP